MKNKYEKPYLEFLSFKVTDESMTDDYEILEDKKSGLKISDVDVKFGNEVGGKADFENFGK